MRADYVRTAEAKGLPRRRVIGVHTLRNSLIPVVTFLGADIGALLGGAIVTEGIFNIPGIGGSSTASIRPREGAVGRRHRHPAGARLPLRQPDRRPALRRARPEDPL